MQCTQHTVEHLDRWCSAEGLIVPPQFEISRGLSQRRSIAPAGESGNRAAEDQQHEAQGPPESGTAAEDLASWRRIASVSTTIMTHSSNTIPNVIAQHRCFIEWWVCRADAVKQELLFGCGPHLHPLGAGCLPGGAIQEERVVQQVSIVHSGMSDEFCHKIIVCGGILR